MQIGQLTVPEGLQSQGCASGPAHAAAHARQPRRSSRCLGAPSDPAPAQTLGRLTRRPASPRGCGGGHETRDRTESRGSSPPCPSSPTPPRPLAASLPGAGAAPAPDPPRFGGRGAGGPALHVRWRGWCVPAAGGIRTGPLVPGTPWSRWGQLGASLGCWADVSQALPEPRTSAPSTVPTAPPRNGAPVPGPRRPRGARGFPAEESVPTVVRGYLSPAAASSLVLLGVWVVTYTSLSLASSSSSLLTTQLSA